MKCRNSVCESGNSFEIGFLDTYRFMPSSLDTLAPNLVDDQMNTVKSFFSNDVEFQLMRKKGIFPYAYLFPLVDSRKLPSHQGKHSIII